MHIKFSRFLALSVAGCWLLCGQQAIAQGSFIFHTKLTNPNPDIFFGPDGVPVYNGGAGGPHSVVSIDLNHDGTKDYRVVATGTVTWGFQMEGSSLNAVWAHPSGGPLDRSSYIVPLSYGTSIGPLLPAPDQWVTTEQNPFGVNGSGFSSYTFAGASGLFINQTAYAGLQFYLGADVYYGWIKVQEIPALAGGGIVFEYAYDIRPNSAKDPDLAPLPFNPHPELPVTEISPGIFVVDDTGIPDTPAQEISRKLRRAAAERAKQIASDPVLAKAEQEKQQAAQAASFALTFEEVSPWWHDPIQLSDGTPTDFQTAIDNSITNLVVMTATNDWRQEALDRALAWAATNDLPTEIASGGDMDTKARLISIDEGRFT